MLELRVAKFVAGPLQVGIPLQFPNAKTEIIGQVTDGFDNGKPPAPRRFHGLHPLRLGDPFGD
jgi:hypothetical protein